ncbi:MAG: hypothetical protein WCA77_02825 [Thermoplasmata archaeon]
MSTPSPPDNTELRLRALERQVQDLQQRVAILERRLFPRLENPTDTAVVQRKVQYDWQA